MTRYYATMGNAIECYHVSHDGRYVSTITIRDHTLSAEQFASTLARATKWFEAIAAREVKPSPPREHAHTQAGQRQHNYGH